MTAERRDPDWFDQVIFWANRDLVWDGKRHQSASGLSRYLLPGMPGQWSTGFTATSAAQLAQSAPDVQAIREILGEMVKRGRMTPKNWRRVQALADKIELTGSITLGDKIGEFHTSGRAKIHSHTQHLALLIAELVYRGLDDRVRICDLPSCNNFFIAWRTKGPQQKYCTTNHASQHRVQRKRKRDAQL